MKLIALSLPKNKQDETTLDLMTQLIVFQEKTIWMFKVWLG